jgi:hypothetical protein
MKHLTTSLIIGACLLLSSAGVVFATDPHVAPSANGSGQPGTNGVGMSCGGMGTNGTAVTPPPGQAINSSINSPFKATSKKYAGAGAGNSGANSTGPTGHANSQYDVACFQMH